jgi:ABC-2 type transport system permease protein
MSVFGLIFFNETHKRLLILWRYKFRLAIKLVSSGLIFIGACIILPGQIASPATLAPLLLGYIVWFYARFIISASADDISDEAQIGTLEQVYMSPVHMGFLIVARLFAQFLSITIMATISALSIALSWHITIPFRFPALLIFVIMLGGLFGFSLMLSGLALIFKQVDDVVSLIQLVMLFFTGALLPITSFPQWVIFLANALPITQGISLLKEAIFNGQSLPMLWATGAMAWLAVNALVYFCMGVAIYLWCERIAKRQGSLGQY